MGYYGIIEDTFWTGDTGIAIRERGGLAAQILAIYSFSNRHDNMIGLYQLRPKDAQDETGLSAKQFEKALTVLADTQFAFYDWDSRFIWVREMARFRLKMHDNSPLSKNDLRVKGVHNLYNTIRENPWLSPFFDRYSTFLHLTKRRGNGLLPSKSVKELTVNILTPVLEIVHTQDVVSENTFATTSKPLPSPLIAPYKPVNRSVSESTKNQSSRFATTQPPSLPVENVGVITKICHQLIDQMGLSDETSVKDAVKDACGKLKIDYDGAVVNAALDSAKVQRRRARK